MTLRVDPDVPVPADAKAVIVAQSLVAARYVQLAPRVRKRPVRQWPTARSSPRRSHRNSGRMGRGEGPVDPIGNGSRAAERRLRHPRCRGSSIARPNALNGNGEKLHETLAELSGLGRTLADGSGTTSST